MANSSSVNRETLQTQLSTQLFLGGTFCDASDGETFEVRDPADDSVIARVASATEADAETALDLAVKKQKEWQNTAARDRAELLRRCWEAVMAHADELTLLQTWEMGRALPDSAGEVTYGAEYFRWFSEEATRMRGDFRRAPAGNGRIVVQRRPVGPVLAITPWNFPLAMATRKIGPALAAGCTIIVKPASKTPLTMLYLAKLMKDAGLPDGVLSILPTARSSRISALLADPRLRKLTFTGSTEVGQKLAAQAAEHSVKVSLELGGNAPFVVLEDADIDKAVTGALQAKMRNGGQACTAANRFYVHESLAEEFIDRLGDGMAEYRMGAGWNEGVKLGPLAQPQQVETVRELVDDAIAAGGSVLLGGEGEIATGWKGQDADVAPNESGYYYPATLLVNVPDSARVHREEIFGPVAVVNTFTDEADAISRANDTEYGLVSYLFTQDLNRALDVAEQLASGMVAVNRGVLSDPAAPFGGVKESGLGREGGFEGIDEYTEPIYIGLEA